MAPEPDDTVRLVPPRAGMWGFGRVVPFAAALLLAAGVGAGGTWWALRPAAPVQPAPAEVAAPAPVAPAPAVVEVQAPVFAPPLASQEQILADAPEQTAVYRFALQPQIVVLQFPSLGEQARTLNRLAALIEKAGFPHDRVLPAAELNARIVASAADPDTFYYGHDYSAASVVRFFTLADGASLAEEERRLYALVLKLGWESGASGALISLVRQLPNADLDAAGRATILRHELSHGVYFTDPVYASFVRRFWNETMTSRDREQFTAFLAKDGYDTGIEDLVINETQAYLVHTPDPRFFNARAVGLPDSRIETLRRQFVAGMPPSWLRDLCTTAPAEGAGALIPVRAP